MWCTLLCLEREVTHEKRNRSARLQDWTVYRWTDALWGESQRWWDTIRSNGVKDGVDLDNGAGSGAVLRAQWFRATSPKVVSSSPGKILMLNCSRNVVSWLTTYLDSQLIPTAWQANKDFIFCQQNSTVLPTITRFFFFKSLKNDCSYW